MERRLAVAGRENSDLSREDDFVGRGSQMESTISRAWTTLCHREALQECGGSDMPGLGRAQTKDQGARHRTAKGNVWRAAAGINWWIIAGTGS